MRAICMSGSMSGVWKRSQVRARKAPPDERGGKPICSGYRYRATPRLYHEDQFRPPRLSARYRISQATFSGAPGSGGVAPIPAIRLCVDQRVKLTLIGHSLGTNRTRRGIEKSIPAGPHPGMPPAWTRLICKPSPRESPGTLHRAGRLAARQSTRATAIKSSDVRSGIDGCRPPNRGCTSLSHQRAGGTLEDARISPIVRRVH